MGNFEKTHAFTALWEGGRAEHPADPGGTTNYGISLRFLKEQGDEGDIDGDGDVDADDVLALTPEAAARLMKRHFWDPLRLDELKPFCAAVIYDTAVNMGASCARRLTQKALGLREDGVWGPLTFAALRTCSDRKTAVAVCHLRRARYHELVRKNAELAPFLRGWLRRVDSLEKNVEQQP